jgi:hypothetical protein
MQVALFTLANSAVLLFITPLGQCKPCDESLVATCGPGVRNNKLSQALCPDGQYNDLATFVAAPTGTFPRLLTHQAVCHRCQPLHSLAARTFFALLERATHVQ